VIDDFLPKDMAARLRDEFPPPTDRRWHEKQYLHQKNKQTMTRDLPATHAAFFAAVNAPSFLRTLEQLTGIPELLADPELLGGGLHQSLPGAFLDVHVDYNFHPQTRRHRRLNLLVYLNDAWRPEYEGYLELWEMRRHERLAEIAPLFNRAVLFETNDISYHGHPHPLACPPGMSRKSLAVYYFSETREDGHAGPESNTKYRQTSGARGYVKTLRAGILAARDRVREEGIASTTRRVAKKIVRRALGQPPENG
jgi:Rps23 Pro-64 3,4-dihydroxylase Tpa1-like proline 4-hydroxylase